MKPRLIGADTTLVRQLNSRAVLRVLRSESVATLTELANLAGLSRPTTAAVLDDLVSRGLAEELGPVSGASGRPARRYRFRRRAGHAVGLAFAPDHILVVVSDLTGERVAQERRDVDLDLPAPDRLALARRMAIGCAASAGPVWAAAAGTSGVVERSGRVRLSTRIPGWTGLDLAAQVGQWFDCPGYAGNDASLAALAEQWQGNARYTGDVVLMLTGHRVGYGLVIDGRVHAGRTGAAGELGKMPKLIEQDPWFVLARAGGRTPSEVFAAARSGDEEALALVDEMARGMARGASVMVMAMDPEVVVIAGDFVEGGDLLLEPVRQHLAAMCLSVPAVTLSALGGDGVALGAIRLALNQIEESPRMLGPGGN